MEIKVPPMGESIKEAIIGTILKPTGSLVKADDEILELETDKVNQVLYAPNGGEVTLTVQQGQSVKIGEVLGHINPTTKEPVPLPPEKVKEAPKQPPKEEPVRSFKEDLVVEKPYQPPVKILPQEKQQRKKMSTLRKVIAQRLVDVQKETAMLTTFNEVDLSQVLATREKYQDAFVKAHGVKLGLMSFFVKATVSALQKYPDIHAFIEGDEIIYPERLDIGIAVGTDRGVIVPVLRDCEALSFAEIEQQIATFSQQAKKGGLTLEALSGGSFTITNGGVFGSLLSTPILNPPQSGILGMHKIQKRAVVIDDAIVIRPMMYVALSYDHRIVDGKEAVSFLVHLKNSLEDLVWMQLEI